MREQRIWFTARWQIEGHVSETKLRQAEIFDYKKHLAEAETRHRQQQSLFEAVRAERNLYSKSLVEAQEEVQDLKSKLKITSQQIEQLKEDIATKETSLVKEEFRKRYFRFNVWLDPLSLSAGPISIFRTRRFLSHFFFYSLLRFIYFFCVFTLSYIIF